jgi:hypothetical protein
VGKRFFACSFGGALPNLYSTVTRVVPPVETIQRPERFGAGPLQ